MFVKFEISQEQLVPHVHLVDLLESLHFTHFNSGPGQIMLKEKDFYEYVEAHSDEALCTGSMSAKDKAMRLLSILDAADIQLIKDRERRSKMLRGQVSTMAASTGILARDQRELSLGKG